MIEPVSQIYQLENSAVDTSQGCLLRDGKELHLRPQTFQVLVYLLAHRERLVSKDELIEQIWDGAAVTDNALVQCIADIRRVLNDDFHHPRFIKTITKQGYRFIGAVTEIAPDTASEFEERTTVEIEYEEDIDETEGQGDRATRGMLRRVASRLPRRSVTITIGLIVTLVIATYFFNQFWSGQRPIAVIVLPQVPGKKTVAVMHFENRSGNTELDWLREGLADMLIINLSRSDKLTLLSRQQLYILLDRIGHQETNKLSLEAALKIAQRSRAEVIVIGSFAKLGEKIRIDALLHDATNGQLLAAESLLTERPGQVLAQIDLLSLKLASHLDAAPIDKHKPLAEVMTQNLEAYRYYSLAVKKSQAYHTAESVRLLEQAIALDPEFAMAHARIGYAYAVSWNNERERAKPYLEKAFQLAHRLTERDRLYITAWYAIAQTDNPGAIQAFRQLIAHYPYEIEAYLRLGYLLRGQARFEEAINVYRQALVIDPDAKDIFNALGFLYSYGGRYSEAVAAHERYVQLAPQEPNAYDSLGLSYIEAGRYAEALSIFNRALALNRDFHFANLHLGDVYFSLGRYREAIRQYERYLQVAPSNWDRSQGYHRLALLYLRKGEMELAEAAAQQELKYQNDLGGPLLVALVRRDLPTAEKLLQQLLTDSAYTEEETQVVADKLYYFRGLFALKSGQAAEAIGHFQVSVEQPTLYWNVDGIEDCLAQAYLELSRLDESITEYKRLLKINPNWPLAHYRLGLAYERKGEQQRAQASLKLFLQLWKDADTDAPEVVDAKMRLTS